MRENLRSQRATTRLSMCSAPREYRDRALARRSCYSIERNRVDVARSARACAGVSAPTGRFASSLVGHGLLQRVFAPRLSVRDRAPGDHREDFVSLTTSATSTPGPFVRRAC